MEATRREFLERVAATAMLGVLPVPSEGVRAILASRPEGQRPADQWDLSWVNRVTGKYRAVFDVPAIDSGYGVFRAWVWGQQYADLMKVSPRELSPVLVLRADGVNLALQQSYWDKYGVGKAKNVVHPLTQQPTDRNPALLSSTRNEIPADFDEVALDRFIAHGGIALACDLALQEVAGVIQAKDGGTPEDAHKRAVAYLVPGVILQPSGVFAALRAQDAGCKYLRAS